MYIQGNTPAYTGTSHTRRDTTPIMQTSVIWPRQRTEFSSRLDGIIAELLTLLNGA